MNKHFLNKRLAHQLGFIGLVPFVLLLLACAVGNGSYLSTFITSQQAFGMVILSFLGGIHWGATMVSGELTAEQTKRALCWSIVPTLISCLAAICYPFTLAVLIAGFVASYQVDKRLFKWYKLPEWFIRLRLILTCCVIAALLLTIIVVNARF